MVKIRTIRGTIVRHVSRFLTEQFGTRPAGLGSPPQRPERNRVNQVNTGFAVLRQHIPVLCGSVIVYGRSPHYSEPLSSSSSSSSSSSPPASSSSSKKNKMNKVEILWCAVEYIRNLEKLLATGGRSEMEQDQLSIKEKPLYCLPYELDVAVGSPSMQESHENISPLEIAGLSTSTNDLSGFYDSSSSPELQSPDVQQQNQRFPFPFLLEASPTGAVPTGEQKQIKTDQDPADSSRNSCAPCRAGTDQIRSNHCRSFCWITQGRRNNYRTRPSQTFRITVCWNPSTAVGF